ncbi:pyrroline-5-carboxylate reductase [Candidatus Peregrinibacteria bacterium]|nr:pyrroline-5-carboxylate reductase [Candidatus Peregrinibacteria bacterium]
MGKCIKSLLGGGSLGERFSVVECEHTDDPNEKLKDCGIFILAVKPQSFVELAAKINIDLSDKLAISIMAGVSIASLQEKLKMKKVVRTLPNLALKIGKSFTPWVAADVLSLAERIFVKDLLRAFGDEMEVKGEDDIVAVGAMSGCGPAYFAYIAEQIKKSAISHGFSSEEAEKIANVTFVGSAEFLENEGISPEELRAKVASKGGSTEAAFRVMEGGGLGEIFLEGIEAAIKRTKELGK